MNKTRIILSATGGVVALAVLTMAYFTWSAFSEKAAAFEGDEENDGLETVVGEVRSLLGKKPFPSKDNKRRIDANRQTVEEWTASARKNASRGDWCADPDCSPAQFKEAIVREAKAIGPIVAEDFSFGPFKDYLADKMPTKDQLADLQRQWQDITSLIRLLATNGVTRLADLQVVEPQAEESAKPAPMQKSRASSKNKAAAPAVGDKPSVKTYRLTFTAKPAAFVGVIRTLSFQERFTVVEGFGFTRERDVLAEALGGEEKKDAPAATGRRGRRRAQAREDRQNDEEKNSRGSVAFDPETDAALKVDLTVSVYDFRSLEDDEKGDAK